MSYDFSIPDKRSTNPDDYVRKDRRGQLKRSWSVGVRRQRNSRQTVSFDKGLTWGSIGQILGYVLGEADEEYQNALFERMLEIFHHTDRGSALREPGQVKVTLRVATWNLQYSAEKRSLRLLNYLKSSDWDLVALQEVSAKAWKVFQEDGIAAGGYYTLDGFGVNPTGRRQHGVAVLVRNGLTLSESALMEGLPKKERAIATKVDGLSRAITFIAWHAPNKADEGLSTKMQGYTAITNFIKEVNGPLIVGFDSNHWNRGTSLILSDPVPPDNVWYPEKSFFSNKPPHQLSDSLIEYLKKDTEAYESALQQRPEGPLAVSYMRGSTKRPVEDRFDYLFISPDFDVDTCIYDYDGATGASSDHAMVFANVRLREA